MRLIVSRKQSIAGVAALTASAAARPLRAAQFEYKYANNQQVDSPLMVRATQMWRAVEDETQGRLAVKIFPNSQLGGETEMISQLRLGAIQFFSLTGVTLSNVVPVAGIEAVPFAFKTASQAYAALDGALGAYIRGEMAAKGIHPFDKVMGYGFYQLTNSVRPIRVADDMIGLKFRSAASKIAVDTMKSLGSAATPLNFAETYSALQTHLVDGQTNPYQQVETAKLYEVQKYLTEVNMTFAFPYFMANVNAWSALPPEIQAIVVRNQAKYALLERRDVVIASAAAADKLVRQGMVRNVADVKTFRDKLSGTGFYGRWREEFGAKAWALLEQYTGKLA